MFGLFESGGDCHHHFFKVEFAVPCTVKNKDAYCHIKIPIFPYTLEFEQENRIFLATRSVLWSKTCRICNSGRSPRPLSRLGRGHPSIPTPLGACGASMLPPLTPRSSSPWHQILAMPLVTTTLR